HCRRRCQRLTRTTVGLLVVSMLGMMLRVGRHGPRMDVHRECANVAEHHECRYADEQPRRQTPGRHGTEPSECPASCQAFGSSILARLKARQIAGLDQIDQSVPSLLV